MAKLLMVSVLVASLGVPMYFARGKRARPALRKAVAAFSIFLALWTIYCAYAFERWSEPIDLSPPQ